jgi:4,4'-diaponeurosporenoate glycosyltransferase
VSVVIPARNEGDRIATLLADLVGQQRRPDQIIVVDDGSVDDTVRVATAFDGVDVNMAPELPAGWTGKSWACTVGAAAATGDVLVFLDADVSLRPDALGALIESWQERGGLVSVQPRHVVKHPIEALSLPFNVVLTMGLGIASVIRPRKEWGAAGPCMITSRVDYDAVGGHESVAGDVAEDLALASRYHETGRSVRCVGGADLVTFRMYRNLHGLIEGWSKNIATGAGRTPILRGLATAVWVTTILVMALRVAGLATELPGQIAPFMLFAGGGFVQVAVLGHRVGRFGAASLIWPLLFVVFVAVFAWSALRTVVFRQVRWSGRSVSLTGVRPRRSQAPSMPE